MHGARAPCLIFFLLFQNGSGGWRGGGRGLEGRGEGVGGEGEGVDWPTPSEVTIARVG